MPIQRQHPQKRSSTYQTVGKERIDKEILNKSLCRPTPNELNTGYLIEA